jgi:hypothetical protein
MMMMNLERVAIRRSAGDGEAIQKTESSIEQQRVMKHHASPKWREAVLLQVSEYQWLATVRSGLLRIQSCRVARN